jgi:hypothetical protein
MEINKNQSNEPTVGSNFFESIPPVVIENYPSLWKNSTEALHITNSIENKQATYGNIKLNETRYKAVVKGFGCTALFTASLLMASKQLGVRIRLDDGTSKHSMLSNAEHICKRNSTIVRKYYDDENIEYEDTSCETKTREDIFIPTDFPDEMFASDYLVKSNRFDKVLEGAMQ